MRTVGIFGVGFTAIAAAAGAGGVIAQGAILSATVRDSTIIDPRDIGAGVLMGPDGNGWVMDLVLKGITSTAGTIDPTKLLVTVSDPGYNSDGTTTTRTRVLVGRQLLRRQYPNNNGQYVISASTDLLMSVALSDWIYAGSTVTSVQLIDGFWPGDAASFAQTIVNGSTKTYPKPVFAWMNLPHERATASTHAVEGVAFHRYPMNGQPVACVEYVTPAGTARSGALSLSAIQSRGYIAEVFASTVDLSSSTNGAIESVNAKIKPWIGDTSAILDLAVDGVAWPTTSPQTPLRVLVDRTGAYGGAFAYVKSGASGGTVSATEATARAAPYPTIEAAITAVVAWNNTNKGHNDHGGAIIRLMDAAGSDATFTQTSDMNNTAGLCWMEIEPDPLNTGAITVAATGITRRYPNLTRFRGALKLSTAGGSTYPFSIADAANTMLAFDGVEWVNAGNTSTGAYVGMFYQRNLLVSSGQLKVHLKGVNYRAVAAQIGVIMTAGGAAGDLCAPVVIGCQHKDRYAEQTLSEIAPNNYDGRILYNNYLPLGTRLVDQHHFDRGQAFVQNLNETTGVSSSSFSYSADGTVYRCLNVIEMYQTSVGERSSRMYNDNTSTKIAPSGMLKSGVCLYNVWDNINVKSENFLNAGNPGLPGCGNWTTLYSVGHGGNVDLYGNVSRASDTAPDPTGANDNYICQAWPTNSSYNLQATHGLSQAQIQALFTNYTAAPKGSPTLGGNYQPTNAVGNPLHARVPSGVGALGRDLYGNTRRQDGSGAAGAIERAA